MICNGPFLTWILLGFNRLYFCRTTTFFLILPFSCRIAKHAPWCRLLRFFLTFGRVSASWYRDFTSVSTIDALSLAYCLDSFENRNDVERIFSLLSIPHSFCFFCSRRTARMTCLTAVMDLSSRPRVHSSIYPPLILAFSILVCFKSSILYRSQDKKKG